MSDPEQFGIEWYRWRYMNNPTWLGTQALKLWEHYAALEAKLEAMDRVKMHLDIVMRLTTKDEVWQYVSLDAPAILEALAAAQQEEAGR